MDPLVLIFLSSGLFLGWSLGGNDSANVFGTAVGSRMISFRTAAITCAIFVVLGAVISGAGAAGGLGALGAVNALPGSFTVALCAALTVYWMTKAGLPVSTTQAVVGGIVGWNIFTGSLTDMGALTKIVGTWVACPLLGALFAMPLYWLTAKVIAWAKIHLVWLDFWTRVALVLAGAFGAYSLGANNIANVMGVFVSSSPFEDIEVAGLFTLTSVQQLFLLGALAIAVGCFYSKAVMMTVGTSIMQVSSVGAFVVVVAQSLVLFVFSSQSLQDFVTGIGLPPIPLVPVSSSQAVVGSVIGVGLCHGMAGARQIKWSVLGNIGIGWVATPVISAVLCFVLLFIVQNVFQQEVHTPVRYELSPAAVERLQRAGVPSAELGNIEGQEYPNAAAFRKALRQHIKLGQTSEGQVIEAAKLQPVLIDSSGMEQLEESGGLTTEQLDAVGLLGGQRFEYAWELSDALVVASPAWNQPDDDEEAKTRQRQLDAVVRVFMVDDG